MTMRYILLILALVSCGPHYEKPEPKFELQELNPGISFKVNNKDMLLTRSNDTLMLSWKDSVKRAFPRGPNWDKSLKVIDSNLEGGWMTFKLIWVSDSVGPKHRKKPQKKLSTIDNIQIDGIIGEPTWSFSAPLINGTYVTSQPVTLNELVLDELAVEQHLFHETYGGDLTFSFQINGDSSIQIYHHGAMIGDTRAMDSPWKVLDKERVNEIITKVHMAFVRNHCDSI
jgi:hypothetical protein